MKKLFRLVILFILPGLFVSCETDFNVIADYKEIVIVYGLLNQSDTIHYLRINKAFLGQGNALTYAQVADSSRLGDDVTVTLTETTPAGIRKEIVFDTVTLSTKDTGIFYNPYQLFYYSDAVFDQNNTYDLNIINTKTLYEVSSQTNLIHDFYFTKPSSGAKSLNFKRSNTQPNKFSWENAENGKRYQLKFYFNFKELSLAGDTTYRMIEWAFPVVTTEKTDGNGESDVSYLNEDFFKLCENKIPYSDPATEEAVIKRFSSTCDLRITVIGDEFNTFLVANGIATGVLMDKPMYSNIKNGLGLFSSTYQMNWFPEKPPLKLSPETIMDLSTTTNLKFAKPN
jgi:hypothetical protein